MEGTNRRLEQHIYLRRLPPPGESEKNHCVIFSGWEGWSWDAIEVPALSSGRPNSEGSKQSQAQFVMRFVGHGGRGSVRPREVPCPRTYTSGLDPS
jgi:hypothetical protein